MTQDSDNQPAPPSVLYRVVRTAVVTFLVLFVLLFLSAGVGSGFVELIFNAAFGWVMFLKRTLPQITLNWSLVGMAALACFGILGLAHWFLGWVTKTKNGDFVWPIKWTISAVMGVALLFLVGMSIGGIAHQVGWIVGSDEPLYERKGMRFYELSNMRQLDLAFRMAQGDANEDLAAIRRELWKSPNDYLPRSKSYPPIIQSYHLLVVVNDHNQINGIIVFPRDAKTFAKSGGYYSIGEEQWEFFPAKKLNDLLQKHRGLIRAI